MATLTQKSQEERPVYCRYCYIPMENIQRSFEPYHWFCQKCGLEWKPKNIVVTKTVLREEIRSLVASYQIGESLNLSDFKFIRSLLDNHPNAQTKIGSGVSSMRIELYLSTRGLRLTRVDGTSTDFSWRKCLTPPTHRTQIIAAFRSLIEPQVFSFKQEFFDRHGGTAICEVNKTPIKFIGSHVDHKTPKTFSNLLSSFLEKENLSLDNISLKNEGADNKFHNELANDKIKEAWIEFHAEYADLRVISKEANLTLQKMKADPSADL